MNVDTFFSIKEVTATSIILCPSVREEEEISISTFSARKYFQIHLQICNIGIILMILIFLILKTFSIEADSSFINYLKRPATIISYYTSPALT